jgi:fatty acid desaturase
MISMVGVAFASMYGVLISLNYAVMLSFIGRQTPVPDTFNMENPESIFWTIEVLGYFFMGLSTGMLAPLFHSNMTDRAIQFFFLINTILGIGGLIGYWMDFPLTIMLGGLMIWNIIMPIAALLVFFHFKNIENSTLKQL